MANKRQLDILLSGVDAWNAYRDDHPDLPIDLQGAKLQGAKLQGAKLQRANLQGADLREADLLGANLLQANVESVKSQEGPMPVSWDFTDLSTCLFLTQTQLNSMKGDSGTIIPDHLERPAHWPELDLEPDEEPAPETASSESPGDRATALVDRLADASPVEYGVRNGKLYPGDRPLNGRPPVDNPTDLEHRILGQRRLVLAIREDLRGSNKPGVESLLRWLDRYETALDQTPITWYETDDAIGEIQGILVEQGAAENWLRDQFSPCDQLCKRHREMEPLLRPEQPKPEPDGGTSSPPASDGPSAAPLVSGAPGAPTPLAHLDPALGDGSPVSEQLHEIADSDDLDTVAEPTVRRDLENFAGEIDEIRVQVAFTPEQKGGLLKRLAKIAKPIAALLKSVAINVATKALTDDDAAEALLKRLRALWDLLQKVFEP